MSSSISASTLEKFSTFGDFLRFLRRRAGITQLELSIAVGYSDAQISRLEQNLRLPDIPMIQARFVPALGLEDEPKAVTRLLELAANVRREDAPDLGLCPYKGLHYFEETDAGLFVGREALTAKVTERVLALTAGQPPVVERFLAIIGASGSGKSSLVRAGLIPALRWNKTSTAWNILIFTPTARPLESLALSILEGNSSVAALAQFIDDLHQDPRSLHLYIKRKLNAAGESRFVLVVDQFEELFALCHSDEERSAFIGNLLTAASEADGPLMVIITLRADFYAACASEPRLRDALARQQEYIGAMTDEELCRAIVEPAHRGRWELEPGLVDLLLHDVGHEPGALPLLSHTLMETWQRRRARTMTLSGYTAAGGVRGAIAETAEAVFTDQFTREQQEIARRIFLRLTELSDETGAGDTRRRASLKELIRKPEETAATEFVLKVLADARLITTGDDAVEVAHEALIREWPTLRQWLENNREEIRLYRHMSEAALEWERLSRETELLYRGARLNQASEWAAAHADEMNMLEREFLAASIEEREREIREREEQRQRELESARTLAEAQRQRAEDQAHTARQLRKRSLYLTFAFFAAFVMALTALFFGSQARQTAVKAENDRRIAYARELSAAALNNLPIDPERSILLALQAISTTRSVDGVVLPEAEEALHRSIIASPIRMTLKGHQTRVLSVAYRPDGRQLASVGDDGAVIVWDASTGAALARLPGATKPGDLITARRIAYAPNGAWLVVCDDSLVNVYDVASWKRLRALTGQPAQATAVAVRPDEGKIASGGSDGTIIVWDAVSGRSVWKVAGHQGPIESVTFSPDGKWLITASDDATMKIWNAATGSLIQDYADFKVEVYSTVFSPDGARFVVTTGKGLSVWQLDLTIDPGRESIMNKEIFSIPEGGGAIFSPDGTQLAAASGSDVKLWDASTGRELITLVGHSGWVMGLAFSPDGKQLASTSLDGSVKLWSVGLGKERVTVAGVASGYGTRVAYSPDGSQFATNGGDGSATLWDAETGRPLQTLLGHSQEVLSLAYSPDGKRFATGSLDNRAIVWDTANGQKLVTLEGHENGVRDLAFSPDGSLIATGSFDGTARLWDAKTGEQLRKITGHQGLVLGVAFSPDGTHLATSSTDTTAKIWDVKTGELLFTLTGHTGPITDIAYSPDGKMLATGSGDTTVKLWYASTGKEIRTLKGHASGIQSVAFRSDGKWIVTGSGDKTAKLWDTATGQEVLVLSNNPGEVTGAAFRPAHNTNDLVIASGGIARVYLLQIDDLIALAKSRVTRSLSMDECQRYLHMDHCPADQ